ncbi:MAG: alkylation response protein AidB-like acyl-CoA dehydrogenase [Cycloclasticus pugetii]|jgi:alkylation response protein AidB-like acyl-CoA dehydrogenase|uniref:Acyl-CoA dehydrogenase n=1 Tax=Cycloclasticus zancles 78-ME TaxID=1198232 RepID=S5TWL4_9GAMM|nr:MULTISPECIES: acyl-CoA dehydrogenase [Cycloclasticus]AGS39565.1 Acyl-CoA dehydrogenase [Cycloclasticus zancles 78-ME]MBV1899757.1 acyl-CoA dehydrogenase [Cycloclasticus sp.]
MNLEFTEEMIMLQDGIHKFLQNEYDFETRQSLSRKGIGYSEENWQNFADMGLLGVPFDEEFGGFGFGQTGLIVIMEAIGKGLVVEPYLASIVLGGLLIQRAANTEQKEAILPALIAGEMKLAFAYAERQSRYNLTDVEFSAQKKAAQYCLSGAKSVVFNAETADKIIVSARTSGDNFTPEGISLFIVDKDIEGLTSRDYETVDGLRASELTFDNVMVDESALVGDLDGAFSDIEYVIDAATAAVCAEGVGVVTELRDKTVEYLKTRKQFDQPIGNFQVLQHRCVDMFMTEEQLRSLSYLAAIKVSEDDTTERVKSVSAAKVYLGDARSIVGEQAAQLHGGIGVTDELDVAHYVKRLTMMNAVFGDRDYHLQRFSQA